MQRVIFHFDVVSPYAYLAFEQLPEALAGISHHVVYRPVLFAGLLKAWGHKGPVEIPAKREWTYRQVDWLARQAGVPLQLPTPHPFNPLALLRLALACDEAGRMPELKALTDAAIAQGLFGVPSFEAGGRLYWGLDALPMLRQDLLAAAD